MSNGKECEVCDRNHCICWSSNSPDYSERSEPRERKRSAPAAQEPSAPEESEWKKLRAELEEAKSRLNTAELTAKAYAVTDDHLWEIKVLNQQIKEWEKAVEDLSRELMEVLSRRDELKAEVASLRAENEKLKGINANLIRVCGKNSGEADALRASLAEAVETLQNPACHVLLCERDTKINCPACEFLAKLRGEAKEGKE